MLSFRVPKIILNTKIIEVYIKKCICNCTTSMTAIDTNKETCCQTIICIWLPAYGLLNRERNLWRVVHLLKYSLILSLETFSGRFPTHRWRVSLTIAPANHRCWHPGGLNHPLTSLSSTWPLVSTPHTLSHKQAPAVTDVRTRLPCRLPGGGSARTGLSPLLLALPAVDTNADFSHKNFTPFEFLSFTAHNDFFVHWHSPTTSLAPDFGFSTWIKAARKWNWPRFGPRAPQLGWQRSHQGTVGTESEKRGKSDEVSWSFPETQLNILWYKCLSEPPFS